MKKHFLAIGLAGLAGMTALYSCNEPKTVQQQNYSIETPSTTNHKSQPYSNNPSQKPSSYPPKAKEPTRRKESKKDNPVQKNFQDQSHPNLPYTIPKTSPLEEVAEDQESAWYDLQPEERDFRSLDQVGTYFNAAIDARDYRVAESYLADFQKIAAPQEYERLRKGLLYIITSNYNEYLNDILEHCGRYDSDSVLRKILWMNFFTNEHPEVFPIPDQNALPLDTAALFKKGITALDSIKYCPEKHE